MIHLNEEAILYAVSMCKRRSRYQVGIVTSSIRVIPRIEEMIMSSLRELNIFSNIRYSGFSTGREFWFDNGSYICIISNSCNLRGKKAHLLVVDEYIDYEMYQEKYRPIECLEDIEAQVRHLDAVKWVKNDWLIPNPFYNERETADVSEDEFLKIIS